MGSELTPLVAAQLSAVAYTSSTDPLTPPSGWSQIDQEFGGTETLPDTTTQFVVYADQATEQIVFAFRGSLPANLPSDLANDGGPLWESIKAKAVAELKTIQTDPRYAGYTIITDGYSLGGGMAQTMALEKNLSGYGQNSLPVSVEAVSTDNISYGQWQNWSKNYTFTELNLAGDPATFYYTGLGSVFSGGAFYLNTPALTTTIANPYVAGEVEGAALTGIFPLLGVALTAWSAYESHSIDTVVRLLSQPGAISPENSALNAAATADRASIDTSVEDDTWINNPNGSITVQEANGAEYTVSQ